MNSLRKPISHELKKCLNMLMNFPNILFINSFYIFGVSYWYRSYSSTIKLKS